MRVFVSWSGDRSRAAALGLKSLLEDTFPGTVEVFFSEHIDAGQVWARRLQEELEQSEFGVLCLTEENFQAPWLLFEAGAIAKRIGSARVVPYLIDELPPAVERSPLHQFQGVKANRDGTFQLVRSINAVHPNPHPDQRLERLFNGWWSDFEQTLKMLPPAAEHRADARSDRQILETILERVSALAHAQIDSMGPLVHLPSAELAHLLNLRDQPTINYSLRGNLKNELRHLRDLGLIRNKRGPIGQLPDVFQLDQYFELSGSGRDYLERTGQSKPRAVAKGE